MHLTVVAVPVIALLAILVAVRPTWYLKNTWLATGLAALAVVSTAVTNSTGEALMVLKGASEENPGIYADHALYAKGVIISAGALLGLFVLQHFLAIKTGRMHVVIRVLLVIVAIVTIISTVATGHEGAALVWR